MDETNKIPLWIRQISHQIIYDGISWHTQCPPKSVALFEQFFTATGISYSYDALCEGCLRFDLRQSEVDSDLDDAEYLFRRSFQFFLLQRYGAMNPSHCDGHLRLLHKGIPIPEYSITIPWYISRDSLFDYIPKKHFSFSFADWPILTFTLSGMRREFAFNFVTHPDQLLYRIDYNDHDQNSCRTTYQQFCNQIAESFGSPDMDFDSHTRWFDEQVLIDCMVRPHSPFVAVSPDEFQFSISNSSRYPLHWNFRASE